MVERATAAGMISAVEHERLQRNFAALNDQFEAANDVLAAVGRSASDPDTVLTTIVDSARRLCRSQAAYMHLLENGVYRLTKAVGLSDEFVAYVTANPMPVDRQSLTGRVGLDRRTQQIPDVLTDPEYGRSDMQRIAGYRTVMAAPMLLDNEVVGTLSIWRTEVDPFNEREQQLLGAFAGQAAMALNSVNLVQALEARGAELARKVNELEALRDVGETVSASLDVDTVLSTIAMHAVELTGTDGGSIMEYDDDERAFAVRAAHGTDPAVIDRLRRIRIDLDATLVGRAAKERRPLVVADLAKVDLDPHLQILFDAGWRSVLAVPMVREEQIVGALVIRRKTTGGFADETVELLQTFASQSALALLNAQLFRELEVQSAALEVASRHKSEFLASMSHELRTPLNAVIGFSEVLLEQMFGEINERQEEYLRDIYGSGKHLLDLLNEILDLSKVEAGQMEFEYSLFDLPAALEYAVSMLRGRAASHSIELRVAVQDGLTLVESDELRFKQVVLNLVTNAVKFTPDGGSVVIRAGVVGPEIQITVTDTGVGVPVEDRERIFESFQQGGRGASREEGTGLGLTLSRRIVELLGGRMWLDSAVGEGSVFGFSVPISQREVEGRPNLTDAPEDLIEVVLIEDDRPSVDLLTAYLSGAAVSVTTARDGQSGLEAVRRMKPAAVLLDIRLPGIDGWAVLKALKNDPETRQIPVIVVSIVDERSRGASLGAAAYLVKPTSREDLLSALTSVGLRIESPARPVRMERAGP